MSATIEIDGVSLIPIKDAAAKISYSRDYVSRLAREGKIVASQIGRQWFVDFASLQNFSANAELIEDARKEVLRIERRRELHAKEEFITLEKRVQERIRGHRLSAATVTFSALSLGLTVGVTFYTAWLYLSPLPTAVNSFAVVSSADILQQQSAAETLLPLASEPHQTMQLTTVMEQAVFAEESTVRALDPESLGVLLVSETGTVGDSQAVEALFSDDVLVEFSGENSGTIFFDQGEGVVVEHPFVAVPVKEAARKKVTP